MITHYYITLYFSTTLHRIVMLLHRKASVYLNLDLMVLNVLRPEAHLFLCTKPN